MPVYAIAAPTHKQKTVLRNCVEFVRLMKIVYRNSIMNFRGEMALFDCENEILIDRTHLIISSQKWLELNSS